MKNIHEPSTLYFINIIAKLSGATHLNELETLINQPINYNEKIKSIQKKHNISCKKKHRKNKDVFKISCPAILYNEQGEAFLLANRNNEQVLVQSFGQTPPEIWDIAQLQQQWSGHWLHVSLKQGQFDITWFQVEFLKYKSIILWVLFFSFILQILALVSPIVMQVIMDKVLVHNSLLTLDVLVFGLIIAAIIEVTLKGLRQYIYHHNPSSTLSFLVPVLPFFLPSDICFVSLAAVSLNLIYSFASSLFSSHPEFLIII